MYKQNQLDNNNKIKNKKRLNNKNNIKNTKPTN